MSGLRREDDRKPLTKTRILLGSFGVGNDDASIGIREGKEVGTADLPEWDSAILYGEIISACHQSFQSGQFGEKGVLTLESSETLVLKILKSDDGVFEIAGEVVGNLGAPAISDNESAKTRHDQGDDGHAQEQQSIGPNTFPGTHAYRAKGMVTLGEGFRFSLQGTNL